MLDQRGPLATWPVPPDVIRFEQVRTDYLVGLACTNLYIAEGMWGQATKWKEEVAEDDSVLEQALRVKAKSGNCSVLAEMLEKVAELELAHADYSVVLACHDFCVIEYLWRQALMENDSELEEILRAKAESGDCPVLGEVHGEDQ